jgi:hypothetical protein
LNASLQIGVQVIVARQRQLGVLWIDRIRFCLRDKIMWRQGDVLIAAVDTIPPGAVMRPNCVLAEGELTGHSHRVDQTGVAELHECGGVMYLQVLASEAKVVHQEHGAITLPQGVYTVWQQREYTPKSVRRVAD